ncbi:hypothetical protein PAHAL_4G310600 [Panicum hallii]|uniref:Uncharacterized protein n=1 Tax=Panicum hallii TaxID=206008 RepID=A0A2T8JEL1_9POAL|nr:hypothetical protein PAHAL_4G310600 [Panicum hallii]
MCTAKRQGMTHESLDSLIMWCYCVCSSIIQCSSGLASVHVSYQIKASSTEQPHKSSP